jgi:uncharacterized protein (TIGR03437 family)
MIAYIVRLGKNFQLTPATSGTPYPSELGGVQVLVDGTPCPIYAVTETSIYFITPNSMRRSGFAEVLVTRPSTGEIVGAGLFEAGPAAPGFYTANQGGTGPVAATNPDGTVNSQQNGVARGEIITFWLTGHGFIPGLPPDGVPANAAIPTVGNLRVIIGAAQLAPSEILYSGVSPQYPGLWQLNVRIPALGPVPNQLNNVLIVFEDVPSNIIALCTGTGSSVACPIGTDTQVLATSTAFTRLWVK